MDDFMDPQHVHLEDSFHVDLTEPLDHRSTDVHVDHNEHDEQTEQVSEAESDKLDPSLPSSLFAARVFQQLDEARAEIVMLKEQLEAEMQLRRDLEDKVARYESRSSDTAAPTASIQPPISASDESAFEFYVRVLPTVDSGDVDVVFRRMPPKNDVESFTSALLKSVIPPLSLPDVISMKDEKRAGVDDALWDPKRAVALCVRGDAKLCERVMMHLASELIVNQSLSEDECVTAAYFLGRLARVSGQQGVSLLRVFLIDVVRMQKLDIATIFTLVTSYPLAFSLRGSRLVCWFVAVLYQCQPEDEAAHMLFSATCKRACWAYLKMPTAAEYTERDFPASLMLPEGIVEWKQLNPATHRFLISYSVQQLQALEQPDATALTDSGTHNHAVFATGDRLAHRIPSNEIRRVMSTVVKSR
eukprot:ANDGO_07015.mRNA.1 hypothetical protein